MVGPGILCPTIKAFFFSPLIARRILSPTLPTPVLLYTWIHFGGRWYGVFPKVLLSTTRTRVSFCIAWHAPVMLPKDRREWETDLLNNPWGSKGKHRTESYHNTSHSEGTSNEYIPYGRHTDCIQCALWKPDATLGIAHSLLNIKYKMTFLLQNTTKRWHEEWLAYHGLFSNCRWCSFNLQAKKMCSLLFQTACRKLRLRSGSFNLAQYPALRTFMINLPFTDICESQSLFCSQ